MFQNVPLKTETNFHGQTLTLETGLLAQQATASIIATIGETTVMANVVVGKPDFKLDYFPLQVIYEEKMYASGKIRGSRFEKREGKPSDSAILAGRAVDRSLRSLFNADFRNSVQVIITVLSVDEINPPDVLAILAGSTALSLATSSFEGPVSGVRIGLSKESSDENLTFVVNPSYAQMIDSSIDIVISGNGADIMMLEAGANIITEEVIGKCLDKACEELEFLTNFQNEFVTQAKSKNLANQVELTQVTLDKSYTNYWADFEHQIENLIYADLSKDEKSASLNKFESHHRKALQLAKKYRTNLNPEVREELEKFDPSLTQSVLNLVESEKIILEADDNLYKAFQDYIKKIVQKNILKHEKRVDGRKLDETRVISCQVDVLPRVHGSSLFNRGETQVMNILTLGTLREALTLDGMEEFEMDEKRYLHHYNFPAYSVGETGRYGSPGRREIGHGALAEKALLPVLPNENEFPYTMRLVSECLGSNGSTSMASTCSSTLSLMAGGVPLKDMVAGVAMGLVLEQPTNNLGDLSDLIIETKNLKLRAVNLDDSQFIIDSLNPEVNKYLSFNAYYDIELAKEDVQDSIQKIKNGLSLTMLAENKQGQKIGIFSIGRFNNPVLILGLWLNQNFWSKGYGYEGVQALINWAEQNCVYNHIEYDVSIENIASQKIAQKLGGVLVKDDQEKYYPLKKQIAKIQTYHIPHPIYKPTFKTLTDIQGLEDHLGDMDFKVTGTPNGVTAIQLDNKVAGLTPQILKQALLEAKKGRLHILDVMKNCISTPRKNVSKYAPVVSSVDVPVAKIGDVIGSGGKIIRGIEERFGTKVDLENETGKTYIYGKDVETVEACRLHILSLIKEWQVGDKVIAKALRIQPFGVFVNLDGSSQEGMIHVSKLSQRRVEQPEDVVRVGDTFPATIIEIKNNGNIALSASFE
jgi:polyribonucleotide nucleotidyltransferase